MGALLRNRRGLVGVRGGWPAPAPSARRAGGGLRRVVPCARPELPPQGAHPATAPAGPRTGGLETTFWERGRPAWVFRMSFLMLSGMGIWPSSETALSLNRLFLLASRSRDARRPPSFRPHSRGRTPRGRPAAASVTGRALRGGSPDRAHSNAPRRPPPTPRAGSAGAGQPPCTPTSPRRFRSGALARSPPRHTVHRRPVVIPIGSTFRNENGRPGIGPGRPERENSARS
jgi:hypothetical protein